MVKSVLTTGNWGFSDLYLKVHGEGNTTNGYQGNFSHGYGGSSESSDTMLICKLILNWKKKNISNSITYYSQ